MKFIAKNLDETQKFARDFVLSLSEAKHGATVVGLYGDLGSGKTSFTQGVAKSLGVNENIVSPTFVIMKSYILENNQNFNFLIHIDAYRLEHSSELITLGWKKIISDPKHLVFIEWPEKVEDIMPKHIRINFSHTSGEEREIEIVE